MRVSSAGGVRPSPCAATAPRAGRRDRGPAPAEARWSWRRCCGVLDRRQALGAARGALKAATIVQSPPSAVTRGPARSCWHIPRAALPLVLITEWVELPRFSTFGAPQVPSTSPEYYSHTGAQGTGRREVFCAMPWSNRGKAELRREREREGERGAAHLLRPQSMAARWQPGAAAAACRRRRPRLPDAPSMAPVHAC